MIQRLTSNGREMLVAVSVAMTAVKGIAISVNVYCDFAGPETYDLLQTQARQTTYHLIAENEELLRKSAAIPTSTASPTGGIDWHRIVAKGIGGAGTALLLAAI